MLSLIKKTFFTPAIPSLVAHREEKGIKGRDIEFLSVPRYPPFDKGLPNVAVEDILHSQEEALTKIQVNYGLVDPIFKELVLSIVYNYANYIHLLPATNAGHFRGAGGLFRLGIEVAFHSYQAAQECVFSGNYSASLRRELEPRWQHAAFIAGLLSEIYHPLTEMVVVDGEGNQWQSYMTPLGEWLNEESRDTYYIRWATSSSENREMSGAYVVRSIVPKNVMQYLNECSLDIIPQILGAIVHSNKLGHDNQLQQIVRNVKMRVIERDMKADPSSYGKLAVGVHLEAYFIDAMRLLIAKGNWECNQRKSRIWFNHEGVFIVWPKSGQEIIDVLRGDKLPGIPNTTESVADFLLSAKIVELNPTTGRVVWDIFIPSQKSTFMAIKISKPEILFESNMPVMMKESFMPPDKLKHVVEKHQQNMAKEKEVKQKQNLPLVEHPKKEKASIGPSSKQAEIFSPSELESPPDRELPPVDMELPPIVHEDSGSVEADGSSESAILVKEKPTIPEGVAEKLAQIAEFLSYPVNRDASMFVDDGVMVLHSTLNTIQLDIMNTTRELNDAGMLVLNKEGKKIHTIKIKGQEQKVMIIKRQSAILYDVCKQEWWN